MAEGASVGEFIIDIGLLESPAYKEDGQKASEGHQDIGREIVEEIKEITSVYLYMRERAE